MHRAPFLPSLSVTILCLTVAAGAQSGPSARKAGAAAVIKSALPSQVHIVQTALPEGNSSIEIGSDSWAARGYDIRSLIAQVFDVDARRIDLPNEMLDGQRFDVSVDLPADSDDDTVRRLLADAMEKRFGLTIVPESRTMDVYVLTAPNGAGAAMKRHTVKLGAAEIAGFGADSADDLSKVTVYGQNCTEKGSDHGITVEASTLADFERTLEPDLDRVLLDETHLSGSFDFAVSKYESQQQLFQLLQDQLGLVVTPAERTVTVLAVRPAAKAPELAGAPPAVLHGA